MTSLLTNRVFDEISIGETSSLSRTLSLKDVQLFAIMSGNINPTNIDEDFAKTDMFQKIIGNGMWGGALISTVLGTQLPGPGTIYLSQSLNFRKPVYIGDTVTITVKVIEKIADKKQVTFDCFMVNQDNETVIEGKAIVLAPTQKIERKRTELPEISFYHDGQPFQAIMEQTRKLGPMRTAVVHPLSSESLKGAVIAAEQNVIIPILIGPAKRLKKVAAQLEVDISGYEIIDVEHSNAAASVAVEMVHAGEVGMIMKGSLHTDELLHEVVKSDGGLRTDRRLSHVFILDIPAYSKPLILTDAAINIEPDLRCKQDIIQNAIDFALAVGIVNPKVGILSAVETVNPKMQSTLDAAALCKMADRGQIKGGILDGPLAFDNAISIEAAEIKGIKSVVCGNVDILVAPNLEAGNMLAKQLEYLAHAYTAGLVLGAKAPIVLTSRADNEIARMLSCSIGVLYAHHLKKQAEEKLGHAASNSNP